ncbi:hypothetical protein BV25DRAFT_1819002 [Artomyces pyxidatus]|uniref:Uncharacterized protein n=1 Tax=Artomyces pyxidatus TaxID=48021 RepID=A0ACB8TGP8_9AGAM|nr:hypothetical protein BV25DRAFT_1819002 [Artomyces pyxidatus]
MRQQLHDLSGQTLTTYHNSGSSYPETGMGSNSLGRIVQGSLCCGFHGRTPSLPSVKATSASLNSPLDSPAQSTIPRTHLLFLPFSTACRPLDALTSSTPTASHLPPSSMRFSVVPPSPSLSEMSSSASTCSSVEGSVCDPSEIDTGYFPFTSRIWNGLGLFFNKADAATAKAKGLYEIEAVKVTSNGEDIANLPLSPSEKDVDMDDATDSSWLPSLPLGETIMAYVEAMRAGSEGPSCPEQDLETERYSRWDCFNVRSSQAPEGHTDAPLSESLDMVGVCQDVCSPGGQAAPGTSGEHADIAVPSPVPHASNTLAHQTFQAVSEEAGEAPVVHEDDSSSNDESDSLHSNVLESEAAQSEAHTAPTSVSSNSSDRSGVIRSKGVARSRRREIMSTTKEREVSSWARKVRESRQIMAAEEIPLNDHIPTPGKPYMRTIPLPYIEGESLSIATIGALDTFDVSQHMRMLNWIAGVQDAF